MSVGQLDSLAFRREREASWRALEDLVAQVERGEALDGEDLRQLARLYRAALSSLSQARTLSLDAHLLVWLEGLCARAWLCVYGGRIPLRAAASGFVRRGLPRAVRALARPTALAGALLIGGTLLGFGLVHSDPGFFDALVPPELAQGRTPASSTAELRARLFDDGGGLGARLVAFASFLFTHNARIALLACALGVFAGLPTAWLLLSNGLILGGLAGLHHTHGLSLELWSWLLPHGITELLAVVLGGGAGFALGGAWLFPGDLGRLERLAQVGRTAASVALGAVGLLVIAALIEGLFRQAVQSIPWRYAVAGLSLAVWIGYFGFAGRRGAP